MTTEKTTRQAFHDIQLLEQKVKKDETWGMVIADAIRVCVAKVRSGEHKLQHQTYDYLKELGYEDEEIVFIYGIVCAQRAIEQVTDTRMKVSEINVKD